MRGPDGSESRSGLIRLNKCSLKTKRTLQKPRTIEIKGMRPIIRTHALCFVKNTKMLMYMR